MSSESSQPMLLLAQLKDAWPGATWEWDERMKCVTATVLGSEEPGLRATVTTLLPEVWTAGTLASASEAVRELVDKKGGMRGGQAIFCAPQTDADATLIYCLWWPWGDKSRTSCRFGVANSGRPQELFPQIRALFGIK